MSMPHKKGEKPARRRRHKYGDMRERGDFADGRYQVCVRCGAVRFYGDRYSWPRKPCEPMR